MLVMRRGPHESGRYKSVIREKQITQSLLKILTFCQILIMFYGLLTSKTEVLQMPSAKKVNQGLSNQSLKFNSVSSFLKKFQKYFSIFYFFGNFEAQENLRVIKNCRKFSTLFESTKKVRGILKFRLT